MSTVQPEDPGQPGGANNRVENQWGMFCHLAALAGLIVPIAGNIVGPLVIWLMKKDEFPFVNSEGKESLNFQISISIYYLASALLWLVCVGYVASIAVYVFALVEIIMAAIKTNEGKSYKYPLTIRFIK